MKKQLGRYSFGIEEGEKFENPKGCNTGGYEDMSELDERLWAASSSNDTYGCFPFDWREEV